MNDKTKKKCKVSKKTKRSWRKFVDISDVDNFLENQRLEERFGIPFEDRKNEDLFVVQKSPEKLDLLTKSAKRLAAQQKEPKCFASLKPLTEVPDPITKRNHVRSREIPRHPIALKKKLKKLSSNELNKKDIEALNNKKLAAEKRKNRYKFGEFNEDIWEEKDELVPELKDEWMTTDIVRHTLNNTGKKQKKKAEITKKKPSPLAAIEPPHPGTSYNPTYHDHQNLLSSVAQLELKFQKKEKHLNRVTTKMFKKLTPEDKETEYLKEMSEGLHLNESDESGDDLNNGNTTVKSVNPPVMNKKKTLKQRRKIKEQRALLLELKKRKLEKKKVADVYKLKAHEKKILKEMKKTEKLRKLREALKEKKALEPKIIGRVKFEPTEPDYLLSDELAPTLRSSLSHGNILKDRYKSLQKRNIVPPANLVLKRSKAKVKKLIKPEHKIDLKAEMKKYIQ